jgi:hyperosmotically inducible periplasmic protein
MDIRPIGFAAWVAAVAAVAACSPRDDGLNPEVNTSAASSGATRAASTRPPSPSTGGSADARAQHGDPTAAMGAAPASGVSAAKDAQITRQVKAELAAARDLSGARIDVDTHDGVVTLSGPVRTAAVKARASEIARTVQDVRDVNDQLTLATI